MDLDQVRQLALALPDTHEAPHHHLTSFRVGTKIFATAPPEGDHLRIFVDEAETKACVAEDPGVFEELWWGKQLAGVKVDLAGAEPERVAELLEESWRRRATKRQLARLDEGSLGPG